MIKLKKKTNDSPTLESNISKITHPEKYFKLYSDREQLALFKNKLI